MRSCSYEQLRVWKYGKVGSYLHGRESHGTPQGVPHGVPPPPPDHKAGGSRHCDGVAHGGEICPSRELEDPLASQQPCRGLLGPEALPLVGRAPGCDLSDPSQVMEPRGPTSHTATAMDPVHGSQSSFGSTDVTLTAQRGAALEQLWVWKYGGGFHGHGFIGPYWSTKPAHGRHSAASLSEWLGPPGPLGPPGASHLTRLPYMGIPPWMWKWGRPWSAPSAPRPCRTQGAFPFRVSLPCTGPSPPSRESGHPRAEVRLKL